MTFAAHGVLQGMIVYGACQALGIPHGVALDVACMFGYGATLPDIEAEHESRSGDWSRYNLTHKLSWWAWWQVPFVWFHIFCDSFMHTNGKWNAFAWVGEILTWSALILCLV